MYKVIVVEDETMVRRGIILTIDWAALDCVIAGEAANGEEGAELAVRLSPDIIVTDVKMPRMDGVEMITKLREQGCKENDALGVGQINKDCAFEQVAARLRIRHGVQIDSTRCPPLLNTQPNQIGRPRPLQHLKCDHRT